MAVIENMSREDFITIYEQYTKESFAESERHNKALHAIGEKYADFLDTLYEKMFLKLDDVIEKDMVEIENWLDHNLNNHPEKLIKDPTGNSILFVDREKEDDVPDNLHLIKAIGDDNIEIYFEPANKELLKATLYFQDTKQVDERFFKIIELADMQFPEGYLDRINEEESEES